MLPKTVEKPNKFMFQAPAPLDNREWQMLFLNSRSYFLKFLFLFLLVSYILRPLNNLT